MGEVEECDDASSAIIRERLMGQVFSVAAQIVEEGICSMEDVDRGAKVGLRWAIGPFEIANRIGIEEAIGMASTYSELADLELPMWFKQQVHAFEFTYVDVDV